MTIFDLCTPRADVAEGRLRDEEFAADLSAVVKGHATPEYGDPAIFFRHTHPTRGLRALLETVCRRLSGRGGEMNSVIRLDTQFGGGKTHSLIALVHAVQGMRGVTDPAEFLDPSLLSSGRVRVAAMDGESADPANGLQLEGDLRAKSLWGEMAYRLAGREGYERVRRSDETHTAPGADTIVELFGGEPCLILIDEVAVYLRKAAVAFPDSVDQFAAFMQALLKAVASTPRACLVFTLAVRSEDKTSKDAYRAEQQKAMMAFQEAESVAGRKATQLNPTEEDETVAVLRRRLFERVDLEGAADVVEQYTSIWDRNKESLPSDAISHETREQFRRGYPLHPETLTTLIEKTSTLSNFHRIRGMVRLLARTVHLLWKSRPADAFAIHPHHIDPGSHSIRDEITTRLGQGAYAPALAADVAAVPGTAQSTAQQLDATEYAGQPPVASYVARTIFLHTLAFPESAQGISDERLRFSICSPVIEPTFVEAAKRRFLTEALYLDDRPGTTRRFLTEPNLTQMIRKSIAELDAGEVRRVLEERIREVFAGRGKDFEPSYFPSGPYEVPDEIGSGRPYLVVLGYDAFAVSDEPSELPTELVRMATRKGANEELRTLRNNIIFVVADRRQRDAMKEQVSLRLALQHIKTPERMRDLADHQQRRVKEDFEKSSFAIAQAIMQCYRHLFFPSATALGAGGAELNHTAIEVVSASDHPGNGQVHIKRALHEQKKLLTAGDEPDAPPYVRDQTPLKIKGQISTQELRSEFRKAPRLSILLDDNPLIRCIQDGIESEVFVYRKGELVWGKGDPAPEVELSENAFVHTMANAKEHGLWPRRKREPDGPTEDNEGGDVVDPPPPGDDTRPTDTSTTPTPPKEGTDPPLPVLLSAKGPLAQALTELFEKARSQKVKAIRSVTVRLFEARNAWSIHQAVATFREAQVDCELDVGLDGDGYACFKLRYEGTLEKANSIKSFLGPQLQTAKNIDFGATYTLTFSTPLVTTAEQSESFTKAMTKYGGGECYVEAHAATDKESKS
jgi:hypothetical protein